MARMEPEQPEPLPLDRYPPAGRERGSAAVGLQRSDGSGQSHDHSPHPLGQAHQDRHLQWVHDTHRRGKVVLDGHPLLLHGRISAPDQLRAGQRLQHARGDRLLQGGRRGGCEHKTAAGHPAQPLPDCGGAAVLLPLGPVHLLRGHHAGPDGHGRVRRAPGPADALGPAPGRLGHHLSVPAVLLHGRLLHLLQGPRPPGHRNPYGGHGLRLRHGGHRGGLRGGQGEQPPLRDPVVLLPGVPERHRYVHAQEPLVL
mmetsp:Transcript_144665/g.252159  ORF Transcript_144665/g.252159 Transcript_144665/m.252159 type:complete len:255 (+) Transcript_144665:987-1751(+)